MTSTADSPAKAPPPPDAAVAAAEQQMTGLTAALTGQDPASRAARRSRAIRPVVFTAAGGGLRYVTSTGHAAAAGGACAAFLLLACVPACLASVLARLAPGARSGEAPGWAGAAATLRASLPGRGIPAATLTAAARYLPVLAAATGRRTWLYVPRCTGEHTRLCESAGTACLAGGGLLIVGEHLAAHPCAAAASIAHETRHHAPAPGRADKVITSARGGGWGWAAAGAVWACTGLGWPFLIAAAAGFHVISVAGMWAVECACDRGAARAEGRAALLEALDYFAARRAAHRGRGLADRAQQALHWLAGPAHPPVRLRQALARLAIRS